MINTIWTYISGPSKNPPRIPFRIGLAIVLILLLGSGLRIAQYQHDREFWEDETIVAIEIIDKSFMELTGTLNYELHFPIGFLLSEKLVISLLGNSEKAFRLLPLMSSLLALLLMFPIARQATLPRADSAQSTVMNHYAAHGVVVIALLCFAANKHLIYYASELRHYSIDVLVACVLYLLAGLSPLSTRSDQQIKYSLIALGLFGSIAVWFSLSSLYILVAITFVQAFTFWRLQKYRPLAWLVASSALWSISFLLHYCLIKSHMATQGMIIENQYNFLPVSILPTSIADLYILREVVEHIFYFPGGMTYTGLAIFAFGAGCLSMWHKHRELFFLMILPILFAAVASILHQYPFRAHFLLFITPALCLTIAQGLGVFWEHSSPHLRKAGYLLAVLLLAQPIAHSLKVIHTPRTGPGGGSYTTEVMRYIQSHWQEGDYIIVDQTQFSSFLYYNKDFGFTQEQYHLLPIPTSYNGAPPFTLPHPPASGDESGSDRFWLMSLSGIDAEVLRQALSATNAQPEALDSFKSPDNNVLGLYQWNPEPNQLN